MRRSFPTFRRWAASWRNRFRLFLRHEPSLVDNDRGRQRHRLAGSVYVLDADMLEAALPGHENPRHLPDGRPHAARPHDAIALPDLDRFARSQNSAFPRPSPWSRPRGHGYSIPPSSGYYIRASLECGILPLGRGGPEAVRATARHSDPRWLPGAASRLSKLALRFLL